MKTRKETVLWQSRSSVTIFNLCVLKHWLLGFSSFREKEKNQTWGLGGWFCQIPEQSWIQSATSFLFKKFTFLVNTEREHIKRSLKKPWLYFTRQRSSVTPSLVSRIFPLFFSFSGWLPLCSLCWFEGRVVLGAGGWWQRPAAQPSLLGHAPGSSQVLPLAHRIHPLRAALTSGKSFPHLIISTTWVNLQINWCVGGKASAIVKTFSCHSKTWNKMKCYYSKLIVPRWWHTFVVCWGLCFRNLLHFEALFSFPI